MQKVKSLYFIDFEQEDANLFPGFRYQSSCPDISAKKQIKHIYQHFELLNQFK